MTIEDMAGGTFTISNGGIYGSLMGERQANSSYANLLRNSNHQFTTDSRSRSACYKGATSCRERTDCYSSYDVSRYCPALWS